MIVLDWKKKKVLVTGAGGFIGSHLTERLCELGADVTAFVRYNSRNDWGLLELLPEEKQEQLNVVLGDMRDSDAIRALVKEQDLIFHLGALIAIPYSYIHPRETIETNIFGTLNILMAAREYPVEKIIHTSTSEVFGTAQYVPIDEKHPLQGQSPYSASKIGADKIAESFYRSFDLPIGILRPFNTYGPRQSARAVIPTIISQLFKGNEVHLGSLHPTRDFTYVLDTVDGFLKMAETSNAIGQEINIGSNFEISIGDLANKIAEIMNKKIKIITEDKRKRPPKSEVERLLVDNSKARKILNWKPNFSLDEGLRKTINWLKANLQQYKTKMYVT